MEKRKANKDFIASLSDWSDRYIPGAFPLVMILTVLVVVMALILTDSSIVSIVNNWYDGFWDMIEFTMQVCLLMFTGYLVSDAPSVKKMLQKLARIPKNKIQAMTLFLIFEIILYYLHLSLGIAGAVFLGKALLIEQRKKGVYLPLNLMVAIGCFCLVFQGGPTAGSPLLVAADGHFMEEIIGIIPLTESMLSLPMLCMNLTVGVVLIIICIWLTKSYHLSDREKELIEQYTYDQIDKEEGKASTFSEKIDRLPYIQKLIGIIGVIVFASGVITNGISALNLNSINFCFLMAALILHRNPLEVAESSKTAITIIAGVMLQYPFYAGIFGILQYSGLGDVLVNAFVSVSSPRIFTFIIYAFSALLNMLVPSGGSQFMVEAPYIMPAAIEMGVSTAYTLNAFTIGDLVTNLIQPFWALPVLAAFNLKFKQIFPYSFIAFLAAFVVIGIYFLVWMF